jgi:hypothetical protein
LSPSKGKGQLMQQPRKVIVQGVAGKKKQAGKKSKK